MAAKNENKEQKNKNLNKDNNLIELRIESIRFSSYSYDDEFEGLPYWNSPDHPQL